MDSTAMMERNLSMPAALPDRLVDASAARVQHVAACPAVSIVVPALHEEQNVAQLAERIAAAIEPFTKHYELIYVCDGFEDPTSECVRRLHDGDARIKLLQLSRSFGHQNALLAGMDHARGRVVITMDADLQHPPELLADMLRQWEAGYDVVHAVRRPAASDRSMNHWTRRVAYAVLRRVCDIDIVPQSADFKLYDRSAADAVCRLREHSRFNRGLASWIGFRQTTVQYDESVRGSGRASYSFAKRLMLLMNGVFSQSARPLQYLGLAGLAISMLAAVYLMVIVVGWVAGVESYRRVAGWASLVAIALFTGGLQLMGMWLTGQYLARTYEEVKRRPPYIVADAIGLHSPSLTTRARRDLGA